jgi:hypothetical protein
MKAQGRLLYRITTFVTLLVLWGALATAAHAQFTSFTTARIDGTWVDIDRSGNPTCGDAIDFTVTIGAAAAANADNTELNLPIDARMLLDPATVVVSAPNGAPEIRRADSVLDVYFGTVCGPAPCTASTVKFRT